jgi:hypothetical protein
VAGKARKAARRGNDARCRARGIKLTAEGS